MKEIRAIVEAYSKIDFTKNQAALLTVVRVEGSSYRRTGARMLVIDNGDWVGGISGGCLEGDALKKAKLAIALNKPTLITYDTTNDDPFQIGVGLGCNGIIDILISPLHLEDLNNPINILKEYLDARSPNLIVSVFGVNNSIENINIGDIYMYKNTDNFKSIFPLYLGNELFEDISFCFKNLKSLPKSYPLDNGNSIKLFLEILQPTVHLVVYGANYDIYTFVKLAKEIGWKVTVVCNVLKVNKLLFEIADNVVPKESIIDFDEYTVAVLMAHDYETDYNNMVNLLQQQIGYIGMLGPAKRNQKMYERLEMEGKPLINNDLKKIFNPAGLDTGATTPEEISISILAEIRTYFSHRNGGSLRLREGSIHES